MKKHRQLLALLICLVMSVSLLTGYSETKAATEEPTQSAEQDATQETAETREITDMAGRKVTVPAAENIESVFSAGPVAAIFLYMVAPDKLLGWNYELNDVEKSIILDKYQDLPNFGMGDAVNYEAVIAANPTIAINSGKINDAMVSDCDALSESLGIPVVAIGVPTVVDAATIISDHLEHVLEKQGYSEEEIERFIYEILTEETTDVMVTPKNIDESVNQISKDLAKVLNHCFQKRDNYGNSSISFYEKEDMKRE